MRQFTKPLLFNSVIGQRIRRLIPIMVLGLFLSFTVAVLAPIFMSARFAARQTSNMRNLKSLADGCLQYSTDFGDRLPRADRWMDSIDRYLQKGELTYRNPYRDDGDYGYAMNADLSAVVYDSVPNPLGTILVYESRGIGRNHSAPGAKIPEDAFIHADATGSYVVFVDGTTHFLDKKALCAAAVHPDELTQKTP
jgi:hypothetical protein